MKSEKISLYTIQVLSYTAIMLSITFIPTIAKSLGATWMEISFIVGGYNISYFVSSLIFGRLADIHGRKRFIVLGLLLSTLFFFLQGFYTDYISLLIFRVLAGFTVGIFPAAVVSIAHDFNLKMGKLSSWGALGWAIGSYTAGILASILDLRYTLTLSSLFFLIAFVVSLPLRDSGVKIRYVPLFPVDVFRRNSPLYIAYFLRHTAATMIWTFWVLYIESIGGDFFWQAATMGINSTTQFFVMFLYTDLGEPRKLITYGLVFSSLTFLSYAFIHSVYLIVPVQILLALSWSFLYVGALKYLTENNREKATSTGLLNSTISISAAVGPFLGGLVMHFFQSYFILMITSFMISSFGILIFHAGIKKKA